MNAIYAKTERIGDLAADQLAAHLVTMLKSDVSAKIRPLQLIRPCRRGGETIGLRNRGCF